MVYGPSLSFPVDFLGLFLTKLLVFGLNCTVFDMPFAMIIKVN